MIKFEIEYDDKGNDPLYRILCYKIFYSLKSEINRSLDPRKYKIREPFILKSSLIKWNGDPPDSIDLVDYVNNCLTINYIEGYYVIGLDDRRIPGSTTKLSTLIRLLEYGNEKLPAYPLIRNIIMDYKLHYKERVLDYLIGGVY